MKSKLYLKKKYLTTQPTIIQPTVHMLCKRQYYHISKTSQKQPIDYYNHMASLCNRNQLKPKKHL